MARKITLETDRIGNVIVRFASKRCEDKLKRHLASMGVEPGDGSAYLQSDPIDEAAALFDLTPAEIRDLNEGWTVTILADPWTALHCWGWDAHTLAETGAI